MEARHLDGDYFEWPYGSDVQHAIVGAHVAVRFLLDLYEAELLGAVRDGATPTRVMRIAHDVGALALIETTLQMQHDEADLQEVEG